MPSESSAPTLLPLNGSQILEDSPASKHCATRQTRNSRRRKHGHTYNNAVTTHQRRKRPTPSLLSLLSEKHKTEHRMQFWTCCLQCSVMTGVDPTPETKDKYGGRPNKFNTVENSILSETDTG